MRNTMNERFQGGGSNDVQAIRAAALEVMSKHIGRYGVACHNVRDLLPLLSRSDRPGHQWRDEFRDNAVEAAVARGIITPNEVGSLEQWRDVVVNLITNAGLDDYLDKYWRGSSYTAQHYMGLIDGTTPTIAAGDTMASHSGWTEFTEYDVTSGDRPDLTAVLGTVSSQSLTTSSALAYLVNTNTLDCNGAFIATSAAVGASGGTLVAAGTFTQGNKSVDDGDQLSVTPTLTQAAA